MVSRQAAEAALTKPLYAGVGLGELALSALPATAKSLSQQARTRLRTLHEVLSPAALRSAADVYADQAGHAYEHFARRGRELLARAAEDGSSR